MTIDLSQRGLRTLAQLLLRCVLAGVAVAVPGCSGCNEVGCSTMTVAEFQEPVSTEERVTVRVSWGAQTTSCEVYMGESDCDLPWEAGPIFEQLGTELVGIYIPEELVDGVSVSLTPEDGQEARFVTLGGGEDTDATPPEACTKGCVERRFSLTPAE